MRKLMWFTIGFTAACVAGIYLSAGVWLALLSVAGSIPLFFLKSMKAKVAAVILVGFTAGLIWLWGYDCLYLQTARKYDGETISATVTVSDYSFDTDYGIASDAEVTLEGKNYHVRIYFAEAEPLSPGDRIEGELRLRLTTKDAKQGATYHQGDGVFLLGYVDEDAQVLHADEVPVKFFASEMRKEILELMDAAFPQDTLGFARALLLGDSSLLSYEEDTSFKLSGIRHVIAVSGLHVSILFSLVYFVSGKRRIPTALIGIPVLFIFAAVAGFTPSVVRACIMQALMILALLFNKEYDPPTALSFAVLSMLAVNPMTITSVSFQLSAGCLVGIFLFYRRIDTFLLNRMGNPGGMSVKARMIRWLSGSVSITLSAMLTTTPLSAFYFGTISLVGVLSNLVTLWVISFVFYGIMLVCVLGTFWLPAAKLVAWVISWPVRYVLLVAKVLSSSRFSAVYTCSAYVVIWIVMCYALFTAFLLCRRKRPGLLLGCALTGLVLALAASWTEPQLDNYRATVLDVGQGQSILLQSNGRNYLVDCGGDSDTQAADTAAEYLLSQGITRLDGLILTHYDKDHAGGVEHLLTRVSADALYLPDIADDSGIRRGLEEEYTQYIFWVSQTEKITEDEVEISLFPANDRDKGNESCLCVLFQTENCDILITGDRGASGERALLQCAELPKLELLVVGHHGSASSTGFELLNATRPEAAVISVAKDNFHGHPSDEVLFRLELFGCSVWRTDRDGTVVFRG